MARRSLTSQPADLSGLSGGHATHLAMLLEKSPMLGHELRVNGIFALVHGMKGKVSHKEENKAPIRLLRSRLELRGLGNQGTRPSKNPGWN